MHHHLQRLPLATFWPPGVPSLEATRFLGAVAAVKPASFVSTGHTHRHRRRRVGPLVLTEVGSPKDFPGVWAEYRVYEAGITQVVHRISSPEALAWSERCRHLYSDVGLDYETYALGGLEDRCFNIPLR